MVEIKKLSAGSSQIFVLLLRDKNKAPIDANTIHMDGILYTGSRRENGYKFSINKGVTLGCKIKHDMIIVNVNPLLSPGRVSVYTNTYITDINSDSGIAIIENNQSLNIEIVTTGNYMSDRQGAMWDDISLSIQVKAEDQIPWDDDTIIRNMINSYITTPEFINELTTVDKLAKSDLSNIDNADFLNKAKAVGIDNNVDITSKADNNLSNVSNEDFKNKAIAVGIPIDSIDISNKANNDLSNVSDANFKSKAVSAGITTTAAISDSEFETQAKKLGFAQNDLEDVDLSKLYDKGKDAKLAAADLSNVDMSGYAYNTLNNVPTDIFNRLVRQSAAYQKLANTQHPATQGKTDEQIKALFFTNRYEEQNAIDFTQAPYNTSTTIMVAYQMSNGKLIQQTLPPVSDNRIIWVELIREPDATGYKTVISPKLGDQINGASTPITMTEDASEYLFIPVLNENTWEAIPHYRYNKSNLSGSDDFGTIVDAIDKLYFKKPLKLKWNADTKEVELSVEGGMEMSFVDTVLKQTFKSALGQSMDGSIRISMIPKGQDDDGNDIFVVDFSIAKTASQEGVARVAEYTQIINFAYPDNQPKFDNVLYHGGSSVHIANSTDGIVVQEIDGKDPNITGGTLFLGVLDFATDKSQDSTLTQDGKIILALTDKDGNYIKTINGGNAVVERVYKSGQKVEDMRLAVLFKATAYEEVFYKLIGTFDQEEAVSVGLGSGMCIQAIEPDSGIGDALMAYEVYTGSHVEIGKINYSTNNINFARAVAKDSITVIGGDIIDNLGNNLEFDSRNSIEYQIINNGLQIKCPSEVSIFSLFKTYSKVDLHRLNGCDIDISVSLQNKDCAMRVVRMGYKGTGDVPSPKVLSFVNDQPQYNAGWVELDSMFIAEDMLSNKRRVAQTFSFPLATEYDACAFLLRPEVAQTPCNVTIYDFEGDIKPGFVFAAIKEQYMPGQMTLIQQNMFTKSAIMCPIGDEAYRYTINSSETKIPVGIFKQNGFVKNNNAWYDAGSSGKELQGDMEILKSFNGSISYSLNIYNETQTDSSVTVWLARVESDGSFTKIPESQLNVVVKANTTPTAVNEVSLPSFNHKFKKGESYRWFAQADKADGAYIQCNNGSHVPMTEIILNVEYYTEIAEDVLHENGITRIQLMDGGTEVKDIEKYTLQIDIKTNTIKVIKK